MTDTPKQEGDLIGSGGKKKQGTEKEGCHKGKRLHISESLMPAWKLGTPATQKKKTERKHSEEARHQ